MKTRPTPRTDAAWLSITVASPWDAAAKQICQHAENLERELAESREECDEQARLLGMSGEREAALLAKVERLERELTAYRRAFGDCFSTTEGKETP